MDNVQFNAFTGSFQDFIYVFRRNILINFLNINEYLYIANSASWIIPELDLNVCVLFKIKVREYCCKVLLLSRNRYSIHLKLMHLNQFKGKNSLIYSFFSESNWIFKC